MTIESTVDLEGLKRVGRVVAIVRDEMLARLEPGMTTAELDAIGGALLERHGARSAPRLQYDFPGHTCISVNEEMAHGVPGTRVIMAGDVVNIDVSAELEGYFADTGATHIVPPVSPLKQRLCHATQCALQAALAVARDGVPINRIGRAIEAQARAHRFRLVRNLCGHGVGRSLHEAPEAIPGYFDARDRRTLHAGLVIAIEPFLSTASTLARGSGDGWTLIAASGGISAQFEHSVVVTRGAPIVLTASVH